MSRSRRSRRAGSALLLALALGWAAPARAQAPKSLAAYDGQAWRALTEGEKVTLLTGFLIGGAVERGLGAGPAETAPSPEALEAMRRDGRLRFPYAPSVYKARLEDFYFYQDRLDTPLYQALLLINERIRKGAAGGR